MIAILRLPVKTHCDSRISLPKLPLEAIIRRLRKNPDFAAEYLKAALGDEDEPRVLLIALRHLAQAQGIAKVAKAAGIERESLYRALSIHGNPRLSTLVAVTKAIGLRLTVEAAQ
jgi:probable addiction module antidote protein